MSVTTKNGKAPIKDLKFNYANNWRGTGNLDVDYGIQSMIEDLLRDGEIHTPLEVDGDTMEVLKGYRRGTAALRIVSDPNAPAQVVKNLEKVPVVYVYGLTDQERLARRFDDGGFKILSKSEIIAAFFTFRKKMFDLPTIYSIMYNSLARYTGKTEKIAKVETLKGPDRANFLKTWFKGTVEQFMELVYQCGPVMQEQLILTEKSRERELTAEEKSRFLFPLDRQRVKDAYAAMKEGKAALDVLIKKWTDIQNGEAKPEVEFKALSKADVKAQANAGSDYKKAILLATLDEKESPAMREKIAQVDAELSGFEVLRTTAHKALDSKKWSKDPTIHALLLALNNPGSSEIVSKCVKALEV